ncbi:unnamed protein product [Absidia cylindrospora]
MLSMGSMVLFLLETARLSNQRTDDSFLKANCCWGFLTSFTTTVTTTNGDISDYKSYKGNHFISKKQQNCDNTQLDDTGIDDLYYITCSV